jgi:hypothetical protein
VNAPCFTVFLIDRTIHGVDCSCMNQNMEVGRGRWCIAWLLDGYQLSIYSVLYIIYEVTCSLYPFVHSMSKSYYSIKIRGLVGFTGLSNILFRFYL